MSVPKAMAKSIQASTRKPTVGTLGVTSFMFSGINKRVESWKYLIVIPRRTEFVDVAKMEGQCCRAQME